MRQTSDDRGHSYWDLFPALLGQINVSVTLPGQIRGFHMHRQKVDHWVVIEGKIKVVLLFEDDEQHVTKELELGPGDEITIPQLLWHAYQTISDTPATMVYYETAKSGTERTDDQYKDPSRYFSQG